MSDYKKKIVKLSDCTTFRMGGSAELFTLSSKEEVENFFRNHGEYVVIGGGSNILVGTKEFTIPFVKIIASQISVEKEDDEHIYLRAEAGKNWDAFVLETVERGLSGIELLSYIPGSVGASPIQNIGAYGAEVRDTLVSVTVYDTKKKEWRVFSNDQCGFAYRKSIFQAHKEYIIYDTLWKLSKTLSSAGTYPSLKAYMDENNILVSIASLRDAVIAVRRSKLPEISEIASVGSFFKNPIVTKEKGEEIRGRFPKMAIFPLDDKRVKLPAGFLMEHSCANILTYKNLALYEKNKLVVIHKGGGATLSEVNEYTEMIKEKVRVMFGVELIREPEEVS
jgi:UDP-N-acetylmuramate dehydrogenase